MSLAPSADEYHGFFAGYVGRVQHVTDPVGELTAQRQRVRGLFVGLTEERAAFAYAPGKWTIKQLVGHVTDAERIFSYRLLRIARGDETPLPGWDENDYARAAASDDRTLADLLADWTAARDSTIALVNGLPGDAWERRGTANNSPVTARAILYIILGHVEHHRAVLRERYGA